MKGTPIFLNGDVREVADPTTQLLRVKQTYLRCVKVTDRHLAQLIANKDRSMNFGSDGKT